MPASEIGARPPNTTLSPYLGSAKTAHAKEATKRPSNTDSDTQYWRYDVSNKRPRQGTSDGERLCFKYTSTGSCLHGGKCNFRHDVDARELYLKNGCFDYINKGKCERGSDCKFSHSIGEGDNDSHGKQMQRQRSKSCWFCLSSPEVESHLILSIGESYYCALAKGPLVDDHALIIPIEHCPTSILLGLDAELELGRYKNALKTYFKCQGKAVVFYEWMSKQISHANLQAIPVPLTKSADVVKIFNLAAKKIGFEFIIITSSSNDEGRKSMIAQFDGTSNLFYVELPERTILCHSVSDNEKFPGQFGREVLAGLLNMADRADWRNCKLNKEEETKMAEGFKKRFEEFDPAR
ncbi:Zinc finger CCCH domain-containing protein 59 [Acorus calamus]|uniref:Zinc finger CCCH domain-containing protein 59 n=1 Tax=Acorus calamus TaxID=4465 RepID=A0AAV9E4J8_ACOCL|nr:Zinc finger CCCH domain-containing protein 59 [Acorus calamus]